MNTMGLPARGDIVNAPDIKKRIRSPQGKKDYLYIIESPNLDGIWIYTKGRIKKNGKEFYVLISAKLSEVKL
jgi:hypothetical protein